MLKIPKSSSKVLFVSAAFDLFDLITKNTMLTHGLLNDGSWELRIFVTDLKIEKRLRAKGDWHIGGLILKLVEELGK